MISQIDIDALASIQTAEDMDCAKLLAHIHGYKVKDNFVMGTFGWILWLENDGARYFEIPNRDKPLVPYGQITDFLRRQTCP